MLVFDLDGTLFDTMGKLNDIAQSVIFKYYGLAPEFGSQLYKQTSGLPFRYQLERLFPQNQNNDEASLDFENQKVILYQKPVAFFLDVLEHLKIWKSWGLKMAVSSNDEEANVKTKLSEHAALFDHILGHRPGFLKGKSHFDELQNHYHFQKHEMLFIGDSLHDAQMAVENDIPFVGRVGTFTREAFLKLKIPCDLVNDFFELHGLLQHHT